MRYPACGTCRSYHAQLDALLLQSARLTPTTSGCLPRCVYESSTAWISLPRFGRRARVVAEENLTGQMFRTRPVVSITLAIL